MRLSRWQYELFGRSESVYQLVLHILSPILQIGVILWLAVVWKTVPKLVPSHYDAAGVITDYSAKGLLWTLPVIGCVSDIVLWATTHLPEDAWSTGVRVTPFNAALVHRCIRDLIAEMRFAMSLMFAVLSVLAILRLERYPVYVPIVIVALLFLPVVKYLVRVLKK